MTAFIDPADRAQTPKVADEKKMLLQMLAFQRDTLRWKCSGLSTEQLAYQHAPSSLSLGGLLKHLAVVESAWTGLTFAGGTYSPSWLDESQQITERVVGQTSTLDALAQETPWASPAHCAGSCCTLSRSTAGTWATPI